MSWDLVNKGLDLIEEDLNIPKDQSSKFLIKSNQSSKDYSEKKFHKNALRTASNTKRSKSFLNRKVKNAYATFKSNKSEDKTLKNIKVLSKVDATLKSTVNVDKVKDYNLQRLKNTKDKHEEDNKKSKKSKSIFSEEDFEKMNNEWLAIV